MESEFRVLHLIDSLATGGAERVAVNLANALSQKGLKVFLCTTRDEGPLTEELYREVDYLFLRKKFRFDPVAIRTLINFIQSNKIQLIHAHGSSILLAIIVKVFTKNVKVIWHDHYGAFSLKDRSSFTYQLLVSQAAGVIAVNKDLVTWAKKKLRIPHNKVWLLSNFVHIKPFHSVSYLPGQKGYRLICVANLRPQKDHINLIKAFEIVKRMEPEVHLLLVGVANDSEVKTSIYDQIERSGVEKSVTWLGSRNDVLDIMASCDIGILSSLSEGLPLVLLEYGSVGLPVVATDTGECSQLLDHGNCGIIVPPGNPTDLAEGILKYIRNPDYRAKMGMRFQTRIYNHYNQDSIINQLIRIYKKILG